MRRSLLAALFSTLLVVGCGSDEEVPAENADMEPVQPAAVEDSTQHTTSTHVMDAPAPAEHAHHGSRGHANDTWLAENASWPFLEEEEGAQGLWDGRYGENVSLAAARAFGLRVLDFEKKHGTSPAFSDGGTMTVRPGDEIKIAGVCGGVSGHGASQEMQSEVYLYLIQGRDQVRVVASPDALESSDLDPESVDRWKADEQVTFAAYHPGDTRDYVAVLRIRGAAAVAYMRRLSSLPDHAGYVEMVDSGDFSAGESENGIRDMYSIVKEDNHSDQSLVFELQVPAELGTLRLLSFRKEIGLQ